MRLRVAAGAGEVARRVELPVDDREGVVVDSFLQTSDPQIWAAGDIACFEDVVIGRRWHAEHQNLSDHFL